MKPKQILTNKSFCALPWTGFIVQQNGDVKNCVLADKVLGTSTTTVYRKYCRVRKIKK
jgi:hypothetical protein